MHLKLHKSHILVVPFLCLFSLYSQESSNTSVIDEPAIEQVEQKKSWNASALVSSSTNLYESKTYSKATVMSYGLALGYEFNSGIITNISTAITEKTSDPNGYALLGNTTILASKTLKTFLEDKIAIDLELAGIAPTNELQRDRETYRGSAAISPSVSFIYKDFSFTPYFSYLQNFHKFTETSKGEINQRNATTGGVALGYTVIDSIKLSANFENTSSWDYNDSKSDDEYGMSQAIVFIPAKGLSLTVGHKIGDTTFGPDGTTNNIELFDNRLSTVFMTLKYTY